MHARIWVSTLTMRCKSTKRFHFTKKYKLETNSSGCVCKYELASSACMFACLWFTAFLIAAPVIKTKNTKNYKEYMTQVHKYAQISMYPAYAVARESIWLCMCAQVDVLYVCECTIVVTCTVVYLNRV